MSLLVQSQSSVSCIIFPVKCASVIESGVSGSLSISVISMLHSNLGYSKHNHRTLHIKMLTIYTWINTCYTYETIIEQWMNCYILMSQNTTNYTHTHTNFFFCNMSFVNSTQCGHCLLRHQTDPVSLITVLAWSVKLQFFNHEVIVLHTAYTHYNPLLLVCLIYFHNCKIQIPWWCIVIHLTSIQQHSH